ncbi:MAG TPA: hypothetical protein VMI75_28090 [Polyangiaceae bacterium]|nr:hypothetical protein [Polyangiaceae bacterium]
MSWHTLIGTPKQYAGGGVGTTTITLGSGEILLFVSAWTSQSGGSLVVFGGPTITIPQSTATAPIGIWTWWIEHTLFQATGTGAAAKLVFTNVDHCFVHSVHQGNAT